MSYDLQLSSLLCARLCHDLAGPISAISNGIEFLEDDDAEMRKEALELLSRSSDQASRRLQFYRFAFGLLEGTHVTPAEAATTTAAYLGDKKIALEWPDPPGEEASDSERGALKLLINMILLASDSLMRGGTVMVRSGPEPRHLGVVVRADGPLVEFNPALREALERGRQSGASLAGIEPRTVQPFLSARLAAALGADLTVSMPGETPIEFRARIPLPR